MTGLKLANTVVLRPHLALQQEIAEWCSRQGVAYTPRQWTRPGDGSLVKKTTLGRQLCRALRAVGRALTAKSPIAAYRTPVDGL